jgi:hypothetical protein
VYGFGLSSRLCRDDAGQEVSSQCDGYSQRAIFAVVFLDKAQRLELSHCPLPNKPTRGKKTMATGHLSFPALDAWVLHEEALPLTMQEHLAACAICRQRLADVRMLHEDLAIAKASQPSPQTLDRYAALFMQGQPQPGRISHMMSWLRATLLWDSRQQPALAGVRGVGAPSYRVIYSAATADVELWVVPQANFCSVEGDCILSGVNRDAAQLLVQLTARDSSDHQLEAATERGGRFHFAQVPNGVYDLWITPTSGESFVIERLALP